jgi:hypothetical protein
MKRPHLISPTARLLLLPALILASTVALLGGGSALAATYTHESQQAYEAQLAKDEIQSAEFNKRVRNLHLTLKDGRLYLYHYPAHDEQTLSASLKARGIPVTVLAPAAAKAQAEKEPKHHKLRYIAGGILIVVIIIVGAVLLIDRRRKARAE